MGNDQCKTRKVKPVRGVSIISNSSYQVAFTFRKRLCREVYPLEPSDKNTKWVNAKYTELKEAIAKGEFCYEDYFPDSKHILEYAANPAKLITVENYYTDWINDNKKYFKSSGYATTKRIINSHVIPKLGHLSLSELTTLVVDDWLSAMDVSHKTKKNRLSGLRSPLSDVPRHILPFNPLKDYEHKRPRVEMQAVDGLKIDPESEVDAFNYDERGLIINTSRGQINNYVLFNMWTGLRPSEMIALHWDDVDWVRNEIRVWRVRTETTKKGTFEVPKTKAGVRTVPLNTYTLAALHAQKEHTLLAGKEIFHNPLKDKPWVNSGEFNKQWKTMLRQAGVRYRVPYQMRHTFASIMLDLCKTTHDESRVSKAMGHTSIKFTRDTYYSYLKKDDTSNIIEVAGDVWKAREDDKRL